jgi:acetylornithine deacetylase
MTQEHDTRELYQDAVQLLRRLISIPSFSREEQATAAILYDFMQARGIRVQRMMNNIWAVNRHFDKKKPTLLLNSHHDTVKPNKAYTRDPFNALEEDGKLYGLGSNDAGGCLVSLLATFLYYYPRTDLQYNIVFAATAEEEISGSNGIAALLPELGKIDLGIVGEPTLMQMAVAEKGLIVVDAEVIGVAGHAARNEGENALYKAIADIEWFRQYQFPKVSELLGPVKMSVTMIQAGTQHNVVPASCNFTVDIRVNECYTNEEVLEVLEQHVAANLKPRSLRLRSTSIATDHPLVQAGTQMGLESFGSATLSDKVFMTAFPALKIGPGDSARSHTADEFIYLHEIEAGIQTYIHLLAHIL